MTTDLLPNGPYAWTLSALLLVAIIMSIASAERRSLFCVGLLMAGNWVFAQLSSDTGSMGVAAVGNLAAGVLLVLWRTEIALAIAALYVPRLFVLALGQFGFLPVWLVWEISNVFLILQITILAGGSIDGTRKFLARVFDFVGGHLLRAPGLPYFKTEIIDKFGPIHRLDRSTIQKG